MTEQSPENPDERPATQEEVEAATSREGAMARDAMAQYHEQRIVQLSIALDRVSADRDRLRSENNRLNALANHERRATEQGQAAT